MTRFNFSGLGLPSPGTRNAASGVCNAPPETANQTRRREESMLEIFRRKTETMYSEIRTTGEGKRYLLVVYNNTAGDWGLALAEAHNRHPGCGTIPCIAVSDRGRYRVEGEPVREMQQGPHRMAVEPPQTAPECATETLIR